MFPILQNVVLNVARRINLNTTIVSPFHVLAKANVVNFPKLKLLVPQTQSIVPSCGFKVVGKVKRRCKDCYFVRRQERLQVICKTHPRHKQMQVMKDAKDTWVLSHATQSKFRPW